MTVVSRINPISWKSYFTLLYSSSVLMIIWVWHEHKHWCSLEDLSLLNFLPFFNHNTGAGLDISIQLKDLAIQRHLIQLGMYIPGLVDMSKWENHPKLCSDHSSPALKVYQQFHPQFNTLGENFPLEMLQSRLIILWSRQKAEGAAPRVKTHLWKIKCTKK